MENVSMKVRLAIAFTALLLLQILFGLLRAANCSMEWLMDLMEWLMDLIEKLGAKVHNWALQNPN